ncbi:MAG: pirin family protein [Gammaproteobacteria bacterium]|nr:pirin family protein [Gammaproteobacteria bacterium]
MEREDIVRIEGRVAEIGTGLKIARLVPSRMRRTIGAWCFLDHAGPVSFEAGEGMNVGPHPHIGLQTFTWMIEGTVRHLDSLGSDQVIYPNQVNLMTAGKGISHAEISPMDHASRLHAAQLWIALPDQHRHVEPRFQNYPTLPVVHQDLFDATILVGSSFGMTSPVSVYTPLVAVDLLAKKTGTFELPLDTSFEHGITVLEGKALVNDEPLETGSLLYFTEGHTSVSISCDASTRILLIGGEPFKEELVLWWNFVARTQEEVEQARRDWEAKSERFGALDEATSGKRLIAPSLEGIHLKGAHS